MRRAYHLFIPAMLVVAAMFLMTACRKEQNGGENTTTSVVITARYDTTGGNFTFPRAGISITLTNLLTGNVNTLLSDTAGQVKIGSMGAGQYNVAASITLTAAQYSNITGLQTTGEITFNASLNNITINRQTNTNLNLSLRSGRVGNWVIKQVYFAGSHRTLGALYRDQFIEIYNNSTDTLYADSLYIAGALGAATAGTNAAYYFTSGPFAGQYDWSKSLNMPSGINANDDYIYTKWMYMIPGNGRTYPVLPGRSFIVAQTAVNHKSPFTGSDGSTYSVQDPSLTIDLSGAEFEAYVAPYLSNPLESDIDVAASANLVPIKIFGTDLILDNPGRDAFVLFKPTDPAAVASIRNTTFFIPTVTNANSTATQYNQVATRYVIDAVESQPSTAASRVPKKLRDNLDAGFTFVPASSYSSQSVIRKTARTVGGRRILMDTNNSTNDFTYFTVAQPRGFAN